MHRRPCEITGREWEYACLQDQDKITGEMSSADTFVLNFPASASWENLIPLLKPFCMESFVRVVPAK